MDALLVFDFIGVDVSDTGQKQLKKKQQKVQKPRRERTTSSLFSRQIASRFLHPSLYHITQLAYSSFSLSETYHHLETGCMTGLDDNTNTNRTIGRILD